MNLSIRNGNLYIDNIRFCFVEPGNGRSDLPLGRYPVTTQVAHHFGTELVLADGIGWLGANQKCDIVLGMVRGRNVLLPCEASADRLFRLVDTYQEVDSKVTLEIVE
jgi:hypothetical protein